MLIVHLTASTFHGGPERQMLGLARNLAPDADSVFLSFAEGGRCRAFLAAARHQGFEAYGLENDTPRFGRAAREIADHLGRLRPDVLLCHGYKADLLGRKAARLTGVPVAAVSRGWTGETFWVRLYEAVDRFFLRWMDRVVCVSEAQADKVRRCGVRADRLRVIHNAIDPERFTDPDLRYEAKLRRFFRRPCSRIVGAAGRLSPEKGFNVLVAAAERVLQFDRSVGFLLFGEGPCREQLVKQIQAAGLAGSFVLSGFRNDLDRFLPFFDVLALPSFTEGLPNVVLEASAAGIPVVATAVGGTPEAVEDGVSGFLVPPGDPEALAERLLDAVASEERMRDMGLAGRQRVQERFTFAAQARQYRELIEELSPAANAPEPAAEGDEAGTGAGQESIEGALEPAEASAPVRPEILATGEPCEP
jgi:glycosyltransferase involved in cell wall biosynthesis